MAKMCGSRPCNRSGLYLCRGCSDWFCGCLSMDYYDCNATAVKSEIRGTAVCLDCDEKEEW